MTNMKKELEELISNYKQLLLKCEDEERKRQIKKELEECINYEKLYNSNMDRQANYEANYEKLYNSNMDRQASGTINESNCLGYDNKCVQDMNNKPHMKEKTKIKKSYFNNMIIKIKKLISYIQN